MQAGTANPAMVDSLDEKIQKYYNMREDIAVYFLQKLILTELRSKSEPGWVSDFPVELRQATEKQFESPQQQ